MCFLSPGSAVRTSLSLARDSAVMIELYPLSTMALSLADVEHDSPASLNHIEVVDVDVRGRAYLWIYFE